MGIHHPLYSCNLFSGLTIKGRLFREIAIFQQIYETLFLRKIVFLPFAKVGPWKES